MCESVKDVQQIKEYLCQIRKTDDLIKRLLATVATLRANLTSQSCAWEPNKVQSFGGKSALEDAVARIVDLEAEIDRHIDELVQLKRNAYQMIQQIPDLDQQNILIARYMQGLKWEEIAEEMGHDVRWVYRLHGKGLESLSLLASQCQ